MLGIWSDKGTPVVSDQLLEIMKKLSQRPDIRSADQASFKRMLTLMRRGGVLSYQERQQLWALISRYEPDNTVQVPR